MVTSTKRVHPSLRIEEDFWVEEEKRERRIDAVEMMGTAAFHQPLASAGCDLAGGVVALGKFDALHVGHRALAERAAEIGIPFLLSFSGMAQVLGWEPRLPVVAGCDRKRVMGLWSHYCRGIVPQEYNLDFAKVRSLSPQQFVEKLAKELDVKGVVAGSNYRFGYKAAGDVTDLVRLCKEYGLEASIVNPVMDTQEVTSSADVGDDGSSRERGQVSTTRVRKALAAGDLKRVADLLGRKHRIILNLHNSVRSENALTLSISNVLNQPPCMGAYNCVVGPQEKFDGNVSELLLAQLKIDASQIEVVLEDKTLAERVARFSTIAVEFAV